MSKNVANNCCAKSRFSVTGICRQPVMKGKKRCRLHGGKSTGPITVEGKERSARANYKHGFYTNAAIAERRMIRRMMQWRYEERGDDFL